MPAATKQKPRTRAPKTPTRDPDRESRLTSYRQELQRVTEVREAAAAEAERAMEETGDILERAIGAGLSPDEGAQLTRLSRPTTYRQIARARRRREKTATLATYEALLTEAREELGRHAGAAELAARCGTSLEEFLERLAEMSRVVLDEFPSFDTATVSAISRLVLELEEPEAEILRMSVLHRMSRRRIARTLGLPDDTVAGWTTLGLLRALPLARAKAKAVRSSHRRKKAKG
jgi:hypothetical protein